MSNRYGSSNTVSSRLADGYSSRMRSPSLTCWPPISTSIVAVRFMLRIGLTQRSISSIAPGSSSGSARKPLQLLGVTQQRLDPAGDDVAGRLVTADEHEHGLEDEVDVAQRALLVVGVDDEADEVLARAAPALGDLPEDVGRVVAHGLDDLVADLAAAGGEQVRPVQQLGVVGLGEAHQLADHVHRQRRGDVGDDVALAPLDDGVEQRRDPLAQVRLVVLHPAQREPDADHPPPPGVLGRVHVDHRRHRALRAATPGPSRTCATPGSAA